MAQSILQACKVVAVMMLIIGMLAYAWLLFKAFFLGDVATRQMLEGSPGHSFGLPFAAVAAFGIVSLLELTATDKTLEFVAFGLTFKGPAAPVTLWVICFAVLIWAIKAVAKP
jgi:hypothetical protein